jgi:hypothetical protein
VPSLSDNHGFALAAAPHAASVSNYCDHVEHNELADASWVIGAGEKLADLAMRYANASNLDLFELYATRLATIEARNVLASHQSFDGRASALAAKTWRELQLVQAAHDRSYHPDVNGLSRAEQLRHYAFHLAKIVGAFAKPSEDEELINRRLPDTLLFAIKLRTVMGVALPNDALPHRPRAG